MQATNFYLFDTRNHVFVNFDLRMIVIITKILTKSTIIAIKQDNEVAFHSK